jgi:hypothetical protein
MTIENLRFNLSPLHGVTNYTVELVGELLQNRSNIYINNRRFNLLYFREDLYINTNTYYFLCYSMNLENIRYFNPLNFIVESLIYFNEKVITVCHGTPNLFLNIISNPSLFACLNKNLIIAIKSNNLNDVDIRLDILIYINYYFNHNSWSVFNPDENINQIDRYTELLNSFVELTLIFLVNCYQYIRERDVLLINKIIYNVLYNKEINGNFIAPLINNICSNLHTLNQLTDESLYYTYYLEGTKLQVTYKNIMIILCVLFGLDIMIGSNELYEYFYENLSDFLTLYFTINIKEKNQETTTKILNLIFNKKPQSTLITIIKINNFFATKPLLNDFQYKCFYDFLNEKILSNTLNIYFIVFGFVALLPYKYPNNYNQEILDIKNKPINFSSIFTKFFRDYYLAKDKCDFYNQEIWNYKNGIGDNFTHLITNEPDKIMNSKPNNFINTNDPILFNIDTPNLSD